MECHHYLRPPSPHYGSHSWPPIVLQVTYESLLPVIGELIAHSHPLWDQVTTFRSYPSDETLSPLSAPYPPPLPALHQHPDRLACPSLQAAAKQQSANTPSTLGWGWGGGRGVSLVGTHRLGANLCHRVQLGLQWLGRRPR